MTTASIKPLKQKIETDGFAVLDLVLPDSQIDELCKALQGASVTDHAAFGGYSRRPGSVARKNPGRREYPPNPAWSSDGANDAAVRARNGSTYALRNLLSAIPAVRALADSTPLRDLIEPILGHHALAVRGILFDKTPGANWKVAWHQDLSIAVGQRRDVAGFGPWSIKAGVPHVQPPVHVLQNMLTIRLHLDDCDQSNGPLLALPGSHAHGVLSADDIARWRSSTAAVECKSHRGGVLLMRPLILHASAAATSPGHRRVIHIEYASGPLPDGLQWFIA